MEAELIIDSEQKMRAQELDNSIRQRMKSFVELGEELREMRDGRLYVHLEGFNDKTTFEDYVGSIHDLCASRAQQLIRGSIVYRAIESRPTRVGRVPDTEKQLRPIVDKVARFLVKPIDGRNDKKGPVGVANPDEIVKAWEKANKDYEEYRQRVEAENAELLAADPDAKPKIPRPLSATRVYDSLPAKYKEDDRPIRPAGKTMVDRIVGQMNTVLETIDNNRLTSQEYVEALAEKEGWPATLVEQLDRKIDEVVRTVNKLKEVIGNVEFDDN
jgi:hypothetical protein